MAIDTANKRKSMLAFGLTDGAGLVFVPDGSSGSVEANDRAQLIGLYGGTPAGTKTNRGFHRIDYGIAGK